MTYLKITELLWGRHTNRNPLDFKQYNHQTALNCFNKKSACYVSVFLWFCFFWGFFGCFFPPLNTWDQGINWISYNFTDALE